MDEDFCCEPVQFQTKIAVTNCGASLLQLWSDRRDCFIDMARQGRTWCTQGSDVRNRRSHDICIRYQDVSKMYQATFLEL